MLWTFWFWFFFDSNCFCTLWYFQLLRRLSIKCTLDLRFTFIHLLQWTLATWLGLAKTIWIAWLFVLDHVHIHHFSLIRCHKLHFLQLFISFELFQRRFSILFFTFHFFTILLSLKLINFPLICWFYLMTFTKFFQSLINIPYRKIGRLNKIMYGTNNKYTQIDDTHNGKNSIFFWKHENKETHMKNNGVDCFYDCWYFSLFCVKRTHQHKYIIQSYYHHKVVGTVNQD